MRATDSGSILPPIKARREGPHVATGSMPSDKRANAHTLWVTHKVKGQVMDHRLYELSSAERLLGSRPANRSAVLAKVRQLADDRIANFQFSRGLCVAMFSSVRSSGEKLA